MLPIRDHIHMRHQLHRGKLSPGSRPWELSLKEVRHSIHFMETKISPMLESQYVAQT